MKPLLTILSTAAVTGAVAFGGYQAVSLLNAPERWEYVAPTVQTYVETSAEATTPEPVAETETPPAPTSEPEPTPKPAAAETLSGTYRCWSFNAGGAGSRCTSPAMVFSADGTYSMSSERGTYTLNGLSVTLSESVIRGVGALSADKAQLTFHYFSKGIEYTVTYLKQ